MTNYKYRPSDEHNGVIRICGDIRRYIFPETSEKRETRMGQLLGLDKRQT
jgi:hypothetical protein